MKISVAAVAATIVLSSASAFTPTSVKAPSTSQSSLYLRKRDRFRQAIKSLVGKSRVFSTVAEDVDMVVEKAVEDGSFVRGPIIVDKPTGTSFLPAETVERCEKGNPTEKVKLAGDPINAWVDIYEYARKIREGEMTWDEMEKADIDTVSSFNDCRARASTFTY